MQDTVSNLQAVSMLETMMLARAAEEALVALQVAGQAAGTCTSVGQEASSTGVISALSPQDRILTNHRSAGHLLARGADPGRLFAEVLGRRDGYCKGKSGTLHISAKELGVVLTSTIVGGELSLATGVALSQTLVGTAFSRRAGLRSTNYLKLVMEGLRNLSPEMASRFAGALKLEGNEADYFCELVQYNQARTTRERTRAYERMLRLKPTSAVRELDLRQAAIRSRAFTAR